MWNDYLTFLDYLELRRRVEKRLSRPRWLVIHSIIFVMAALGLMTRYLSLLGYSPYFIHPSVSYTLGAWSMVLLLHAALVYRRSGVFGGTREGAIEAEMRARIDADESYMNDNPHNLFRLHGLLDEDVRQRAGLQRPLFSFIILNLLIWALHIIIGPGSLVAWHGTLMLLVGTAIFSVLAARDRYLHGKRMQHHISAAGGETFKRKSETHHPIEESAAEGEELVNLDDYLEKAKRLG